MHRQSRRTTSTESPGWRREWLCKKPCRGMAHFWQSAEPRRAGVPDTNTGLAGKPAQRIQCENEAAIFAGDAAGLLDGFLRRRRHLRKSPGGSICCRHNHDQEPMRAPNVREISWRMACWEPPILAATLGVLWAVRRLKSGRHNEPPVGYGVVHNGRTWTQYCRDHNLPVNVRVFKP